MGGIGSGRQTTEKEISYQIKTISQEALIELATSKVLSQLEQIGKSKKSFKKVQAMALPILLKSIKEHKQIEVSEVKPLLSAIRGEVIPESTEKSLIEPKSNLCDTKQPNIDQNTAKRLYKRKQYGMTREELEAYRALQGEASSEMIVDTTLSSNDAINA